VRTRRWILQIIAWGTTTARSSYDFAQHAGQEDTNIVNSAQNENCGGDTFPATRYNVELCTRAKTCMLRTCPNPLRAHSAARLVAVVLARVGKRAFLRRSRFVYCGRTQAHVTAGSFVPICPYVACGPDRSIGDDTDRSVSVRFALPNRSRSPNRAQALKTR
jgi:hypothetical protein